MIDPRDSNEIREEIRKARHRNPVIDSAFQRVREIKDQNMLRGSDYVRALELALVELEEEYKDMKQKQENLLNNTTKEKNISPPWWPSY